MKVHRNSTTVLRHDWLNVSDERDTVGISILAHRTELIVDVEVDGKREVEWLKPREVAIILARAIRRRDRRKEKANGPK